MFEEKDLLKLTKLSHIEFDEKEKEKLLHSLQGVLKYVEQLKEVNTEGVATCNHVLENASNVMREDEIGEKLPREIFFSNAPDHTGGMIKVPTIIKFF